MREYTCTQSRGFTIIELLVTVSIIAVIVSILLPALSNARASSRLLTCLSNHKQLSLAWNAYISDYRVFPYNTDDPRYKTQVRYSWGGIDWYPDTNPIVDPLPRERPLNLYLGLEAHVSKSFDVFKCPQDNGAFRYNDGTSVFDPIEVSASKAPNPNTVYGTSGMSYSANEWQYCRPGARQGWGPSPTLINFRSSLGPQHVTISPSRFVILEDDGTYGWIMSTEAQRMRTLGGSWWHGKEAGAMSFLDGSARLEKSGLIVNSRYSMYMVPISNPNRSTDFRFPGAAFP